jgi:iron complex transport system substrate-binding protein
VRIVSLLPSATEIVCLLGLEKDLVGVSHECDFPPGVERLPKVVRPAFESEGLSQEEIDGRVRSAMEAGTGVYAIDQEVLASLAPDLIITQELCDVCAVPQALTSEAVGRLPRRPRVLSLHPHSLSDIVLDIRRVGDAAGAAVAAESHVLELSMRLANVKRLLRDNAHRPRVAALEWLDPVMVSGHWVVEMVRRAGGEDLLGRDREPSARVEWDEVLRYDPEVIVLMPCGFDVERSARDAGLLARRPGWETLAAVRSGEIWAVHGGAYFNRPGPRVVDGVEILAEILHPEVFPRREKPEDYSRSMLPIPDRG